MSDNIREAESFNCLISIRYKFSGIIINVKSKVRLGEPSITPGLFNLTMSSHANYHARYGETVVLKHWC